MTSSKIFSLGLFGMTSFFNVASFPRDGETVRSIHSFYETGGKGYNQAYAAKKLGGEVQFVSAIGNDYYTEELKNELSKNDFSFIEFEDTLNDFASVVLNDHGENFVLLNEGVSLKVKKEHVDELYNTIINSDAILVQNELQFEAVERFLEIADQNKLITVFDPAPITEELLNNKNIFSYCTVITPNWSEALELTDSNSDDSPEKVASRLKEMGTKNVVITMGDKGTFVLTEDNDTFFQPIIPVETVDTTGAGDIFTASLCVSLCKSESYREAVKFASVASALSVAQNGVLTAIPDVNEIYNLMEKQSLS